MMNEMVTLGQSDSIPLNQEQYERSLPMMRTIVKAIIGRDLFDTATYFKVVNPVLNPVYREGLLLINDDDRYNRLLRQGRR